MPDLSRKDKLAILERLAKRVDDWRLQRNLPRLRQIALGSLTLSQNSPEFAQWLQKVDEGIKVVFGEYSHYLAEFKDIHYSDILASFAVLAGDKEAGEAYFWSALDRAQELIRTMIEEVRGQGEDMAAVPPTTQLRALEQKRRVFLVHGRDSLWIAVKDFLEQHCDLGVVSFESKLRTSESIVSIVEEMLEQVSFAVIVMTGEDVTADGKKRARENVIHEAGLSQGRLGFRNVVILRQEGVEVPSNLAGLQVLNFNDNTVDQSFFKLGLFFKNRD